MKISNDSINFQRYGHRETVRLNEIAKQVPEKANNKIKTLIKEDKLNDITRMQREITNNKTGKKSIANVETRRFPDGTRYTKTTIEGGGISPITREKSIKIKENQSYYGGDKIIINKNTNKLNEYILDSNVIKEYDRAGNLKDINSNFHKKAIDI